MISTSTIKDFCKNTLIHEGYNQRIERAKQAIRDADCIVVGAGAGLSAAAGLEYSGKRFTDNFKPFIEKYGMKDLYSSSFYPFENQEERWAYWAKHISLNRYETPATELYIKLFQLLQEKDHFVITSNVDGQFEKAGFDAGRLFEVQGNYAFFQCGHGCHDKLYYNERIINEMLSETDDCHIPSHLVPKCPVCNGEMEPNLRKDHYFVQDDKWYQSNANYEAYLAKGKKTIVFLELGVGYNTPGIIRYPFENMVYHNPNATLIRINRDFPTGIKENRESTIAFDEDIEAAIENISCKPRGNSSSV